MIGYQNKLLKSIVETAAPAVALLINGRPLSLNCASAHFSGLLGTSGMLVPGPGRRNRRGKNNSRGCKSRRKIAPQLSTQCGRASRLLQSQTFHEPQLPVQWAQARVPLRLRAELHAEGGICTGWSSRATSISWWDQVPTKPPACPCRWWRNELTAACRGTDHRNPPASCIGERPGENNRGWMKPQPRNRADVLNLRLATRGKNALGLPC